MRVLVSFYSKTGRTKRVAEELAKEFGEKHEVVVHEITPEQELKAARYPKNGKDIELVKPLLELGKFDLVLIGTPVWGFCPSPIVISYIRKLTGVKGKNFALFSTCTALPGTTIKRMSNILAMKNAQIVDSLTLKGLFELDCEQMALAKKFAKKNSDPTI